MNVRAVVGGEGRDQEQPSPVLKHLHLACVRIPVKTHSHTTLVVMIPDNAIKPQLTWWSNPDPADKRISGSAYLV